MVESGREKYTHSNTQRRGVWGPNGRRLRRPFSSMITISPGSMSRTRSASISSKAQVSEATTQPSRTRPSDSGRKPIGSRTAISSLGVSTAREKAPRTARSASASRSGTPPSRERAIRWRISSVSEVVWKIDPSSSRRARSSLKFTRLPLWPMATDPPA